MAFLPTPLAFIYLLAGIINLAAAAYAWSRRAIRGGFILSILMLAISEWTIMTMLEMMAIGIPAKVFWSKLQYIGVTASSPLLYLFVHKFSQKVFRHKVLSISLLWVIPVITLGLAFTNELHSLIWTDFIPSSDPSSNLVIYRHGTWFWIAIVYIYFLISISLLNLLKSINESRDIYRRQFIVILFSIPIVWAFNIAYIINIFPIPGLDPTPLAFSLTGIILIWSFYRYKLFEIVPVAYNELIKYMDDGLVLLDNQSRIIDINPSAENFLNTDFKSIVGQDISTLQNLGMAHNQGKDRWTIEIPLNEQIHTYKVTLRPYLNNSQELLSTSIVISDISEELRAKKQLESYSQELEKMVKEKTEELQEAQEEIKQKEQLVMLGQLAGSVSHELRNPLATISNAVYFLNMTLNDANDTTKEYLQMMDEEINKTRKIISDLLDFSKTPVSKHAVRDKNNLAEIINEVLLVNPTPETIESQINIPLDLPSIWVDKYQINQVLTNLISNAYQAMPDGGKLEINSDSKNGQIILTVSDTGIGIPEENLSKIFEPLFTTRRSGIGLGLAITKILIEANDGTISVESREGHGTAFSITLPVYNP